MNFFVKFLSVLKKLIKIKVVNFLAYFFDKSTKKSYVNNDLCTFYKLCKSHKHLDLSK